MSRTVIYLSNAMFPGNMNNPFLQQEQPMLVSRYNHAYVVSYCGWDRLTRDTETPYQFHALSGAALKALVQAPFRPELWHEVRRLWKDGKLTPVNAAKLLAFTVRGLRMHHWTEQILKAHPRDAVTLYAFWFSYDGYAAALSKQKHPNARLVVRGHYFDIDIRRNPMNPYLMKSFIAKQADGIYFIGKTVRDWFMSYMQGRVDERKIQVLALGSAGEALKPLPQPKRFADGVLHVVSCSRVVPIKRLDVIVDALAGWEGMPVFWTHIGDGGEMERIKQYADEKLDTKTHVIYRFTGNMQPAQIRALYEKTPFDAFINTSEGEGLPVSVMEAMRCGIPAIAADVGGMAELVPEGTGWRFAFEEGAAGVRRCLAKLAEMSHEDVMDMRRRAQAHWKAGFQSRVLLERMLEGK